jgi:hypothetical protein
MRLAYLLLGIVLVGCGARTTGTDDDGSGDGSGDGGSDGSADDGGDGGDDGGDGGDDGGDGGDDGSGDGGTGDPCDPFRAPDTIGPAVAVTIENSTDADVYIWNARDCSILEVFALSGPGDSGPKRWFLDLCEITCDSVMDGGCACPGACPQDTLIRITPGGHYETTWPGSVFFADVLPDVCVSEMCMPECMHEVQADTGTYTLEAAGSDTANCMPEPCECEMQPEGHCFVSGQLADTPLQATATVDYASETAVTVTF